MASVDDSEKMQQDSSCPLCGFKETDLSMLQLHMEETHFADDSDFVVRDPAPNKDEEDHAVYHDDEAAYVDCSEPGCGERLLATDYEAHLDGHMAEQIDAEDLKRSVTLEDVPKASSSRDRHRRSQNLEVPASSSRHSESGTRDQEPERERKRERDPSVTRLLGTTRDTSASRSSSSLKRMVNWVRSSKEKREKKDKSSSSGSSAVAKIKRLGKMELGPYAKEKQMPGWLRTQLEQDQKLHYTNTIGPDGRNLRVSHITNQANDIVPVLAQLLETQPGVRRAYLCDPSVTYFCKTRNEGGFCGYRNAQMLLSYVVNSRAPGCERLKGKVPNILELQDLIEDAWDRGINSSGRIETGGVRGTRKYIGTPEVQAVFEYLQIDCTPTAYSTTLSSSAYSQLYSNVEGYFSTAAHSSPDDAKIIQTRLPPIYLQHRGHSITIVGFERRKSGNCAILVYDPSFRPSSAVVDLVGKKFSHARGDEVLKPFRRTDKYLSKHDDFELLILNPPPSALGGGTDGVEASSAQESQESV